MISNQPSTITVLEREGVILQQKGSDLWGLCPFPEHTEMTPSFKVSTKGFYCFGCNTGGGDSITLVMKMRRLSFKEALAYLGINHTITPAQRASIHKAKRERERKKALVEQFQAWERKETDEISAILLAYRHMKATRTAYTEAELVKVAELQGNIDLLEYRYDILCSSDDREKFELFKEMTGYAS